MPTFNPFSSVTGRNNYTLFDIRLDSDFIVFRGSDHESNGQVLKGTLVLCVTSPLRIEDVRLRLIGTLRFHWSDGKTTTSGASAKLDKTKTILDHRWEPFAGGNGKSVTLPPDNYEWPFEYLLPGDTAESIEGASEASISYRLKATVGRGKLAYDLHCHKHIRIIRTLEPGALELLHAMSVENIWPNKIDYSISIPQKAVPFGGVLTMNMRFTPLLKGLEMGEVTARLTETRDCVVTATSSGIGKREHKTEREVSTWRFPVDRDEHWHDMIEDTGQEGWMVSKKLNLPMRLRQCVQDVNRHGIKVRHKIKLTVALHNPDGHISELRATLPISIYISPSMPLDEHGNLVNQTQSASTTETLTGAPPGYGDHTLDLLYEDMDTTGFQTPAIASGVSSPFYTHSRAGSTENLAALASYSGAIPPSVLSSRLANVSIDPAHRIISAEHDSMSPTHHARSEAHSTNLTRSNSGEDGPSGRVSPEHVDIDTAEFAELNRVPSYGTAVRTPARTRSNSVHLPDYQTALVAPRTPPATESGDVLVSADPLSTITEGRVSDLHSRPEATEQRPRAYMMARSQSDDFHRRLQILQGRG